MSENNNHDNQSWKVLCDEVKDLVPRALGDEAWYLITVATLATSPDTTLLASFFKYLAANDASFASEAARSRLSTRIRDVLLKLTTLVGAPQVLSVLMPLATAEGDVQAKGQSSTLSQKWQLDRMNLQTINDRGSERMNEVYGPSLLPKVFNSYGAHKEDFKFNEFFAVYGIYLSDFEVITSLEAEAVVYSSISCLGLKGPSAWHLRGMGRLLGARGTSNDTEQIKAISSQLENLKRAVIRVVDFAGEESRRRAGCDEWAGVDDIVGQLGGWGEDKFVPAA